MVFESYDVLVMAIIVLTLVVVAVKQVINYKKAPAGTAPEVGELLTNILELVIGALTDVSATLKEDKDKYETEDEYRRALALLVVKRVKGVLIATETPDYLMAVLTDEVLLNFTLEMLDKYKDLIDNKNTESVKMRPMDIPFGEEPAGIEDIKEDADKTDIAKYL